MIKSVGKPYDGEYATTQGFGANPSRYAQFGLAGHNGIDYAVPSGKPIYAGVNGVVKVAGNVPSGYGIYVKIWDPSQNIEVTYAHLSQAKVSSGQQVTINTVIGLSGNTGNSTGPHLHFGVRETDSTGAVINRGNGFDGYINPVGNIAFVNRSSAAGAGGSITATAQGYTGPAPPPYAPTFAGQVVSVGGNNFRSDDGQTWIFQGTDAERAAAAAASEKKEYDDLVRIAADPGVYVQKQNLSERMATAGLYPWGGGLADAEWLVITGPFEARINTGKPGTTPWGDWYTKNGRFPLNGPNATTIRVEWIEVRDKPIPPAPPPLPNQQATVIGTEEPVPANAGVWTRWHNTKGPTTRDRYNLLVDIGNRIVEILTQG